MILNNVLEQEEYKDKKEEMEQYQRNIFGFSFKIHVCSFEYVLTFILTFVCLIVIFGYISYKVVDIDSQKMDVLRSTTIFQEYGQLGKLNLFKDYYLMPVIDIRIMNFTKIQQFDVINSPQNHTNTNYWDQKHVVNINKLNRFINIVINVNNKYQGQSKQIQRSFRKCRYLDFIQRDYDMDKQKVNDLLCPDTQFLQDHLFLQGSYDSEQDRKSFSIIVHKCHSEFQNIKCASDSEIEQLVGEMVFTVSFVKRKVNFKKQIGVNPFQSELQFFQQFMVSLNNYRDTNSFIFHNHIIYENYRSPFSRSQLIKKLDIESNPSWYSHKKEINTVIMSSNGKDYKTIKIQTLAGIYFFLSNKVVIQERQLFTYVTFMSQLGGLMGLIISVLRFVVYPIKFNFDLAKIIQIIYFKKKNKNFPKISNPNTQTYKSYQNKCKDTVQQLEKKQSSFFNSQYKVTDDLDDVHQHIKTNNLDGQTKVDIQLEQIKTIEQKQSGVAFKTKTKTKRKRIRQSID